MERLPHIIETQQFTVKWLEEDFFPLVEKMERMVKSKGIIPFFRYFLMRRALTGKNVVNFFYGASTRTRLSFEFATVQLNGRSFSTDNAGVTSSAVKGEHIRDTAKVISGYDAPDVIVLRTPISPRGTEEIRIKDAVPFSSVPIINAGDRNEQHPTQALIDLYTVKKEKGRIANLTIGFGGDIGWSRTVKSLVYLAAKYPGVKFIFISPDVAKIGDDIKNHLRECDVPFEEVYDVREVAHLLDVYYVVRIQAENDMEGRKSQLSRRGPPAFWTANKEVLDLLPKNAIIMHPLPRSEDELPYETDEDDRAKYFKQAQYGEYVRMALLLIILTKKRREIFLRKTNPLVF